MLLKQIILLIKNQRRNKRAIYITLLYNAFAFLEDTDYDRIQGIYRKIQHRAQQGA